MNEELESSFQSSAINAQESSEMPRRRDCVAIKNQLFKKINGEEYTETLNEFFNGKLSKEMFDQKMETILITPKTQKLHNILMSSIIFNAHFSVSPPQNINWEEVYDFYESQRPKCHIQNKLKQNQAQHAIETRHILSIEQLNLRMIKTVVDDDIIDIEFQAVELFYESIISYILSLLENCIKYNKMISSIHDEPDLMSDDHNQNDTANDSLSNDNEQPILIEPQTILHIIETDPKFSSIISSGILMKYQSLLQDS